MANSPLLGFVELAEAQAIPATSVNLINRFLEAMGTRAICLDDSETDPTAADDSDGKMYVVPSGATGAWTGWADSLAIAIGGAWFRILPRQGLRAYIISGPSEVEYDGANWGTPASTSLALDDLTDVDATAPSDGDVLTWNAGDSEWQAAAPTGGSGSLDIEDEGTPEATGVSTINFTGAGVTATDVGGGVVDVDIPGGGGGGLWWLASAPTAASMTLVSGDATNLTLTDDSDVGLIFEAGAPVSGDKARLAERTISSPSADWTFTVRIEALNDATTFSNVGIYVRDATGGKLLGWAFNEAGTISLARYAALGGTFETGPATITPRGTTQPRWLRAHFNSTSGNLEFSTSSDGKSWPASPQASVARSSHLANNPNRVGFGCIYSRTTGVRICGSIGYLALV